MLTKTFFYLLTLYPLATVAVTQDYEVLYLAAHRSQCTRGNSNCVKAIQKYSAEYYEDLLTPDRRKLQFTCTPQGTCDTRVSDYLWCIFVNGCGRRRLQGNSDTDSSEAVFVPPGDADCYLAGPKEDIAFKEDIVKDLAHDCPCVQDANFLIQICEYPDE